MPPLLGKSLIAFAWRTERTARLCSFRGNDSFKSGDKPVAWTIEGADIDTAVSPVSAFEKETILGEPLQVQRILRGYGGA